MTENELLATVSSAEESGEAASVDVARRRYLERFPDGARATEIRFRLGVYALLVGGSVNEASSFFKEAAADKKSIIANEARISLAICLNAQKKRQQAIFELRKLLPTGVSASANSATALEYLCLFLRESGAKGAELDDVEERRRTHLQTLADGEKNGASKAQILLRLSTAFLDTGSPADKAKAIRVLNDVVKIGANAKSEVKTARTELKQLTSRR